MPPAELATASIRNPFVLAKVSPGEVGEYSADWCSEWFQCLLCYRCLISCWCFELTPFTGLGLPTRMEQWGSALTVCVILCRFLIVLSKSCFLNYLVFLRKFQGPSVATCNFSNLPNPDESAARQVYSYSFGWFQLITHWLIVLANHLPTELSVSDVEFLFLPETSFHTEVWFNDLYKSGYF